MFASGGRTSGVRSKTDWPVLYAPPARNRKECFAYSGQLCGAS